MLHAIALSLIAVINVLFAALILFKGGRRIASRYFVASGLFVSLWSIGDLLMLRSQNLGVVHFGVLLFLVGPMLTTFLMVLFALYFPEDNSSKLRKFMIPFIGFSIPLIAWAAVNYLNITHVLIGSGENHIVFEKLYFSIYSLYLSVHFITVYAILFVKLKKYKSVQHSQVLYCFIGILLSSGLAVVSNVSLPLVGNTSYLWLGPMFTTFYVASSTLAIVKHRLFDVQAFIARFVAYAVSLGVVAGVFSALVFGFASRIFHLHLSLTVQLFMSLTTAVGALVFARIKPFFDKATTRFFYQDSYEPQDLFDKLNQLFVATLDIDKLLRGTATILSQELKADFCLIGLREVVGKPQRIVGTEKRDITLDDIMAIRKMTVLHHQSVIVSDYLEGKDDSDLKNLLATNNVSLLVRLSPNVKKTEEGLGLLALGPKRSGNPYNNQDFRVLDTVAKGLIIAIQNALHFEEIQNFNVTLQQKVVEATNKLRRTNEKLKALDETKDDFISMASHQLRTPLTSAKGYLSMVLEGDAGKLNSLQKKMLTQAFTSSQRMVYLIADLLNVSRLKTGKFVIEPTLTNLATMVDEELSQLQATAAARSLELIYDKPEHFPDLMFDETKIRQVIMNFIDNAIYYTPAGGHITIQLIDNPLTVELKVIDDGIGVPKSEQHHLFTKFYRAGNARKARPDGTGLGLFMAKKVVAAQGGAVIFESKEGKGSTFGFTFSKSALSDTKIVAKN